MCGIAGIINPGQPAELLEEVGRKAAKALLHRGPDDWGIHSEDGMVMTHRRLSVLDLSSAGRQPMVSADGRYRIVYNGEVYNFREMRKELEKNNDVRFRSGTDTEVVLEALAAWGKDALGRLNGMFALGLWDNRERSLLLARDFPGIKPLFYWRNGSSFAFASTISALMCVPGFAPRLSRNGLQSYLMYGYCPADVTGLNEVRQLPSGNWLEWKWGEMRQGCFVRYGNGDTLPPTEFMHDNDCEDRFRSLLEDSVRRQLVADVPVGIFLSGGLDSSTLTCLAAKILGPERTRTFSLGFRNGRVAYDETPDAERVARHIGTSHHVLYSSENDLPKLIGEIPVHFDNLFADPALMPLMLLCRQAREHVTVCLSGEGGDELFAGYRRYIIESWLNTHPQTRFLARLVPAGLLRDIFPGLDRLSAFVRYCRAPDPISRHDLCLRALPDEDLDTLLQEPWRYPMINGADTYRYCDPGPTVPPIARLCRIDQDRLLTSYLEKADRASMAIGLEIRVPFLDREVMAFANSLPDRFRYRGGVKKWILRQTFGNLLPRETLTKPKHGFSVPLARWFRGPLKKYVASRLLDPELRLAKVIRTDKLTLMLERHWKGHADTINTLWALMILSYWLEYYGVDVENPGD
jgi:asparagine synthase (glutamine-hydrolysing)